MLPLPSPPSPQSFSSQWDELFAYEPRACSRPPSLGLNIGFCPSLEMRPTYQEPGGQPVSPWSRDSFGVHEIGPFVDDTPAHAPLGFRNFVPVPVPAPVPCAQYPEASVYPGLPPWPATPAASPELAWQAAFAAAGGEGPIAGGSPETVSLQQVQVSAELRWLACLSNWPWTQKAQFELVAYHPLLSEADLQAVAAQINALDTGTSASTYGGAFLCLDRPAFLNHWLTTHGMGALRVCQPQLPPGFAGAGASGLPPLAPRSKVSKSPGKERGRLRKHASEFWPSATPKAHPETRIVGQKAKAPKRPRHLPPRAAPLAFLPGDRQQPTFFSARPAPPRKQARKDAKLRATLQQLSWRTLDSNESYAFLPNGEGAQDEIIRAVIEAWCAGVAEPRRFRGRNDATLLVLPNLVHLAPWLAEVGLAPIDAPYAEDAELDYLRWFCGERTCAEDTPSPC